MSTILQVARADVGTSVPGPPVSILRIVAIVVELASHHTRRITSYTLSTVTELEGRKWGGSHPSAAGS
jgi:hypothetical protein